MNLALNTDGMKLTSDTDMGIFFQRGQNALKYDDVQEKNSVS